jgi:imidazolonepropionase-like amidohydrolase
VSGRARSSVDVWRIDISETAARCLGIGTRTGEVRPGLEADLIVVEGNPLESIQRLRAPVVVINDGRVMVNRLAPPLKGM